MNEINISELAYKGNNTYFNAQTFNDRTTFEFSTNNETIFFHYLKYIINAIFHPKFYSDKNVFIQEAWRIESDNNNNLRYTGIVYNEMKGIFNSPLKLLTRNIPKILYNDNISGGDPNDIVKVTHDQVMNYHKVYYSTENCYIYIYGNLDYSNLLNFIDEALPKQKSTINTKIQHKKVINEEASKIILEYPILKNENENKKAFISINYSLKKPCNLRDYLLSEFLKVLVVQEFNKKKLKNVNVIFDNCCEKPFFSIILSNCNEIDETIFRDNCYTIFNEITKSTYIKEQLIYFLKNNSLESIFFNKKQPKGIFYSKLITQSWIYGNKAFVYLKYKQSYLEILMAKTNLLKVFIDYNFININYNSVLVLRPNNTEIKICNSLLNEKSEIKLISNDSKKVSNGGIYINKIDYKKIELIKADYDVYNTSKFTMFLYSTNDEKTYFSFYFNITNLPNELINYLPILFTLLLKCSTKTCPNENIINNITISFNAYPFDDYTDSNIIYPKFIMKCSVIKLNENKMFEILKDIINNIDFNENYDQIKISLKCLIEDFKNNRAKNIDIVLCRRLGSYFSKKNKYEDSLFGLDMYEFIKRTYENLNSNFEKIAHNLTLASHYIFNKKELIISVFGEKNNFKEIINVINDFLNELEDHKSLKVIEEIILNIKNEGIIIPSDLQFIAKGYNFKNLGYDFNEKISIFSNFLMIDYFYPQARANGVYNSKIITWSDGMLAFITQNDPNIQSTLDLINDSVKFLKNNTIEKYKFDMLKENEINNIIKINNNYVNDKETMRYIKKIPINFEQQSINKIKEVNIGDYKTFKTIIQDISIKDYYCIIGNENIINSNKNIFKSIRYLI